MALVKCAECKHSVSNKAIKCPYCGYAPKGACRNCKWFKGTGSFCEGRCSATENDFVKEYKGMCPAVIRKSLWNVSILLD